MRSALFLTVIGALFGTGFVHAQVVRETSDVTGVERIESAEMRPLHDQTYSGTHASFRAEYVDDPDEGASWTLAVYGFTDDTTQVSRSTQFLVQADGKRLEPLRLASKTRSLNDNLLEIKRAAFTRSGFEKIATARHVTISIGSAKFVAVRPRREDLRLILKRVPPPARPRTASTDSASGE